jgi:hypothetical protein
LQNRVIRKKARREAGFFFYLRVAAYMLHPEGGHST